MSLRHVAAMAALSASLTVSPTLAQVQPNIGFFAPDGTSDAFAGRVQFSMVNVLTPEALQADFARVTGTKHIIYLDFGPILADVRPADQVRPVYRTSSGQERTKTFQAQADNKLRNFPGRDEIARRLAPFVPILIANREHVGPVFLLDEPYLNGVSKSELERAARDVRSVFAEAGLVPLRLGVNFAAAMFDREFAQRIDAAAGDYAAAIDDYHAQHPDDRKWTEIISTHRLTTYDQAGNMYDGGGVPDGYDIVAFDFYLSTLLYDGIHERTLDWFARRYAPVCAPFLGTNMRQLRIQLSFFGGSATADDDRALLDRMFDCRMGATLSLLARNTADRNISVLLIGEASNNGVLNLGKDGKPLAVQDEAAVEGRVLDEVERAGRLYEKSPAAFQGLMYFTWADAYDNSIHLKVGGADGMPRVLDYIYALARR